jgi:hypothetical protein
MQLEMDFETPVTMLGSLAKGVPDLKVCGTCKEEKPLSAFGKDCTRKDGLRIYCKSCRNKKSKKHYQENRDVILERGRKYRQENLDAIAERKKKHYQENRDAVLESARKYRQENPDVAKTWRKANPEKTIAYKASRRARKKQAQPPWLTVEHFNQIKAKYKNSKRMKKLTGIEHHVDHIVPLKGKNVCGLHVPWNLQVIPAKHNLEKKNHFDDWNLNDG